jgi:hypothetical protein
MTPGTKEIVKKVQKFTHFSATTRTKYEKRWADNLRLVRGLPEYGDSDLSDVRGGSKLYFRKIESANQRVVADFVRHFLSVDIPFEFKGNMGDDDDFAQAAVFQEIIAYYYRHMKLKNSLVVKHVMLLQNIMDLGWGVGKLDWKDKLPRLTPWKNEQVFPDFNATFMEDMKYLVFRSYLTKEDLEAEDFDTSVITPIRKEASNLDAVRGTTVESKYIGNLGDDEYPEKGSNAGQEESENLMNAIYQVDEAFYVDGSKLKSVVLNDDNILKADDTSVYDMYPAIFGSCLLTPHSLIGEGSPERLEGQQRAINHLINSRMDTISLNIKQPILVERDAGVDLLALRDVESGQIILTDENTAVKPLDIPDVTSQAYIEVDKAEGMIEEMLGTTPSKMGTMGASQKATTAQINLQESDAKFGLYTLIVGETFFKQFFYKTAWMIDKFATDKKVRRIANKTFRNNNPLRFDKKDSDNLADINKYNTMELITDVVLDVGLGELQKNQKFTQILMLLEKSAFINTSQLQLLQAGLIDPSKVKLFNPAAFADEILKLTGNKNIKDFVYEMPQEQENIPLKGSQGEGSPINSALAGAVAPQIKGQAPGAGEIKQELGAER